MCYSLVSIKKSNRNGKKMMAKFQDCETERFKTVHFGAEDMSDFTKHKDKSRKDRYLSRHKSNENWNDPTTPGALSRWILWNKESLKDSIADYKRRFYK